MKIIAQDRIILVGLNLNYGMVTICAVCGNEIDDEDVIYAHDDCWDSLTEDSKDYLSSIIGLALREKRDRIEVNLELIKCKG